MSFRQSERLGHFTEWDDHVKLTSEPNGLVLSREITGTEEWEGNSGEKSLSEKWNS